MKRAECWIPIFLLTLGLLDAPMMRAAEPQPIALPRPNLDGGRPFMQVLQARESLRQYNPKPLPLPLLSGLLWAGFGVNRPDTGHRTAPSAMNSQEIDIYVATAEGLYVYDAPGHQLKGVVDEDIRPQTGGQEYVAQAPLALIFVADLSRLAKAKPEERERYAGIDTGYVSQNIYLYCASEGLATVVHEIGNRNLLAVKMKLRPEQKIILAQSVGFPK